MAATSGTRIVPDANSHDSASRLLSWSIALPSIDRGLDSGTAGGLWELEPTIPAGCFLLMRQRSRPTQYNAALALWLLSGAAGGC